MNGRRPWLLPFCRSPFDRLRANGGLDQSFFKRLNMMRLKQTAGTLGENELKRINAWLP
jgi:hypothetical protein